MNVHNDLGSSRLSFKRLDAKAQALADSFMIPYELAYALHFAKRDIKATPDKKDSFCRDIAGVYHHVKTAKQGLGKIVDPLETLDQAKKCLENIDSALSIMEQKSVSENVLLTLALEAGVKPFPRFGGVFSKHSITAMRTACGHELEKLAGLGGTRHRSVQRAAIVDMAANAWKNNFGWERVPPSGPTSPFVDIMRALFSCLKLPGKNDPRKLIRTVLKKPCFTLYTKEQLLKLGYLKPEDIPNYPPSK